MQSFPLSSTSRRFPLLVIPDHKIIHSTKEEQADDKSIITYNNVSTRSLYCMLLKQPLQFQIELPSQFHNVHKFCGSSHGWLLASNVDDQDILHVSLFNPFSKNNSIDNLIINLPPITEKLNDLPYIREDFEHSSNILDLYHNDFVHKAVLSSDPSSNPDEYIIMVIYGGHKRLAFIRPGTDVTWTYLDTNKYERPFGDVIYYRSKIFALDCYGRVVCCEAVDNNWRVRMVCGVPTIIPPINRKYLVESLDGGLLQVQRHYSYDDSEPEPTELRHTKFDVYKLMKDVDDIDYDNSNCDDLWMEIKSIGDCALFLGTNESMSVRASDINGCSSNSIYFTADGSDYTNPTSGLLAYTSTGTFHLEDGSFEQIDYITTVMSCQTPIWITSVTNELN